jgi:hypothetical protein
LISLRVSDPLRGANNIPAATPTAAPTIKPTKALPVDLSIVLKFKN